MEVAASLGSLGGSASSLDTCAARCEAPGPMATPNMLTAAAAGTEETARFDALGPIGAPNLVALSPIGAPKLMEESDDAGTLGAAVEAMVLVLVLVQVLLEVKVLLEVFSRSLQAPELIMLLGTRLIRRDALAGTLAASSRYSSPVCSFLSCSPKVVFPPSLISVMISLRRPTRMEELPSSSGTVVYVGSFLSLNRTDIWVRAPFRDRVVRRRRCPGVRGERVGNYNITQTSGRFNTCPHRTPSLHFRNSHSQSSRPTRLPARHGRAHNAGLPPRRCCNANMCLLVDWRRSPSSVGEGRPSCHL